MANVLYTPGKEGLLNGDFDLNTSEMRLVITDHTDDTPNPTTDNAYDDISAGTVAQSNALDSPTITGGTFDAANETLSAVTGDAADSLTIYEHNATPANALLLVYIDESSPDFPVTPNGGDIVIAWHASGIFSL